MVICRFLSTVFICFSYYTCISCLIRLLIIKHFIRVIWFACCYYHYNYILVTLISIFIIVAVDTILSACWLITGWIYLLKCQNKKTLVRWLLYWLDKINETLIYSFVQRKNLAILKFLMIKNYFASMLFLLFHFLS